MIAWNLGDHLPIVFFFFFAELVNIHRIDGIFICFLCLGLFWEARLMTSILPQHLLLGRSDRTLLVAPGLTTNGTRGRKNERSISGIATRPAGCVRYDCRRSSAPLDPSPVTPRPKVSVWSFLGGPRAEGWLTGPLRHRRYFLGMPYFKFWGRRRPYFSIFCILAYFALIPFFSILSWTQRGVSKSGWRLLVETKGTSEGCLH